MLFNPRNVTNLSKLYQLTKNVILNRDSYSAKINALMHNNTDKYTNQQNPLFSCNRGIPEHLDNPLYAMMQFS